MEKKRSVILILAIGSCFLVFLFAASFIFNNVSFSSDFPYKKEPQDIFRDISLSMVNIITKNLDEKEGRGSGFIITSSGTILTCYHVVADSKEINVRLQDGKEYPVSAIINFDADYDVCILKIDATGLPFVSLGDSNNIHIGEKIYCIGNPRGTRCFSSDGLISGIIDFNHIKYFQFTGSIIPGYSGGPLINLKGEVIGITEHGPSEGDPKINYALPINEIKPIISATPKFNLKEFTQIIRPMLYYYRLGKEAEEQRDFYKAISYYNKAIKIKPDYGPVYFRLTVIYSIKMEYENAWKNLHKAESAGFKIPAQFYEELKKVSEKEK